MNTITVYVSIGNSDDKLSQYEWANFAEVVLDAISAASERIFGVWFSEPSSPFQNACVAFEVGASAIPGLRAVLTEIRADYRQDSVAWAEVPRTEFI